MRHKKFWTLDKFGNEVLRDLSKEHESFTLEKYVNNEFDGNNFIWYENFDLHFYDANGCDYERLGCYIKEGDVVLDIGANIGVFAHRAEVRGASRVICFEPVTPTFSCLIKNKGPKTEVHKFAIGGENKSIDFKIHTDFTHIGGATLKDTEIIGNRNVVHTDKVVMLDINFIFESGLVDKVDFIKMDIEGGEVEALNSIKDIHLSSVRCFAAEFHNTNEDFNGFQDSFFNRMIDLGFKGFILYHGDGDLRTLTFWKDYEK
jgi:FkbM family methyltransferase